MTREKFDQHRESFVARIPSEHSGRPVVHFYACDAYGNRSRWIWDQDSFAYVNTAGSIEDAQSFARNMINQGMCFAFMLSSDSGELEVWLTTWEEPDKGPVWPSNREVLMEVIHDPFST